MSASIKIIRTHTLDPWKNLAVEEYLLDRVARDQCILYIWQNQNTVVIGKNQNAWKECRTDLLEKEGGKLARRLSGGGAVFHDMGNLNFTFLMERKRYDVEKQTEVILSAVKMLGIKAEREGRNDLTAGGRKFSGNAYCFRRDSAYHHGTILVSADMNKMTRYLQVSPEKIKTKGVESIRSRVINLDELKPGLTVDHVAAAVIKAFEEIYNGKSQNDHKAHWIDQSIIDDLYKKYSSWEWIYGETPIFDMELSTRFQWGGVELVLKLTRGIVEKAWVYSDSMDEEFISSIPKVLEGGTLKSRELSNRLGMLAKGEESERMVEDIAGWILQKGF